ncbi:MAG: ABC transporter substrate-binding protein, partial [Actinomycetota bacterium]|nr:ABC transporter substrate-binding protein [Actinomycetota bacterium]
QPAQTSATSSKKVRVALHAYENNITPFTLTLTSFPVTADLVMLVHDSLFWSQVKEKPEPWLAEGAVASEDKKTWTVTLRDNLKWHDGRPLTAEDVRFSFDYYQKQAGSSGRYAHHVFDVPALDRAEVIDPRTIRFVMKQPAPQFDIMPGADLPIIPKHVWEGITEPGKATNILPVGSGPYKVVEMVSDQRYRLVANETYFKGKPTVDEIEIPIVKDPAAAFAALRTGQVDFVTRNVPPELATQFDGSSGVKVAKSTKFESTQLYFNARKPPLNDPKLRKAISLATDTQALVDTVLLGRGRPGRDGFIHPDSPWAMPGGRHEFDRRRAEALLDQAGYAAKDPDGVRKAPNGTRLDFAVLVSSFEPQDLRAVQLMSQQVAPVGVRLRPEALDPATLRQRRSAPPGQVPTYDAYMSTLEAHGHVDPDSLYYFFHSPGPKGFGAQITGWGNPRFDQLTEQAAVSGKEERKPLLHEAQRILAEEAPVIVFWYRDGEWAYREAAYGGWVEDPGQGIFTKRSFLPEYVNAERAGNEGEVATGGGDDGGGGGLVLAGGAALVVGLAAFALARRRRPVTDDEE